MVEKLKRRISFELYLIALALTIIVFVLGIVIGNGIAYQKANELDISQKAISALMGLSKVKGELVIDETVDYCNLTWGDIWKEKVEIGSILSALETRLGKTDKKVMEQKAIYNEVQADTLVLVNKVNQQCNYNWQIILFFYTNDNIDNQGDVRLGELQGYALDTLYNLDKENVRIFSFDISAGDNATKLLIADYNLTYFPSLVINGQKYERFMSRNEIQTILKK